jgi:tetratricopeptide (TPR) repeat protein
MPFAFADTTSLQVLELYRRGDCKDALPLMEQLLQKDPRNSSIRKLMAGCLVKQGRADQAHEQYRKVLEFSPGDAEASSALRPAVMAKATPPPVQAPKRPVEPPDRARAGKPLEEAERAIEAGKLEEAEHILLDLQARQPELALPRQRLAEIYIRTKQNAKAADIFRDLSLRPGASPDYLLRAAQNYSWAADYKQAITLYQKYLDRKPDDTDARLGLANSLLWANSLTPAAEEYQAYLRYRPNDLEARMSLGNALLWSKHFEDALHEFESLSKLKPGDLAVTLAIAQTYEQSQRTADAVATYQAVLKMAPDNSTATEAIQRLGSVRLQQASYERLDKSDFEGAAQYLSDYLRKHPDSNETVLQLARTYSWAKHYADSARFYDIYLKRAANDETARREAAKVDLTVPDFAAARAQYLVLVSTPRATAADYEDLVHAFVWDGKLAEAQPYAIRLSELDKDNVVAFEARRGYETQQRTETLAKAQTLTASARYSEALDAYQSYSSRFGADREIELTVCRIYAWDKQYPKAAQAYQEYLHRYADDKQARLELADIDRWSGNLPDASNGYRQVLQTDPKNAQALLGLAEVDDQRGRDRTEVAREYRRVIEVDPSNAPAKESLDRLTPEVSPSLAFDQKDFSDSDQFHRSTNYLEASVPLGGSLKITPFYHYDYFSQDRQIDGAACGNTPITKDPVLQALSKRVCGHEGVEHGNGGGLRFDVASTSHVSLFGEFGAIDYDNTSRLSMDASANLVIRPSADHVLMLSYIRRDAVYDVNTIGALYAGILGDTALISYRQPLSNRWRLWMSSGATRYSRGLDREAPSNTQVRFTTQLDYQVLPQLTAGYFARVTGFKDPTDLYFSPSFYGVYGLTYAWNQEISRNVRLTAQGDLGYGQIHRSGDSNINTLEVSLYPSIVWRVRPDMGFQFGYRYGRGRSSAFGSPTYTTGAFELNLMTSFSSPISRTDPTRLGIP